MNLYPPGAIIAGQYEVAGRPLMGGMGIVYLCLDRQENRPVALKTFKPEYLPDRAARDRFLREGTTWVDLGQHPHIVRAYQVVRVGDGREVYLVLELVAKEQRRQDASLRSWLTPGRALPIDQALLFALQIARGMKHATDTIPGFVHRDLKPENVLVGADKLTNANVNRLRVTDLGLAKIVTESEVALPFDARREAGPGQIQFTRGAGTPLYMAPEQWKGEPVSVATDVYAWGCILYEMLTGYRAAEGNGRTALERAHCEGKLRPLPVGLPPQVCELVQRCLALDAGARYCVWDEVEQSLAGVYQRVSGQTAPTPEVAEAASRAERVAAGWSYSEMGYSYLDIGKAEVAIKYFERVQAVGQAEGDRRLEAAGISHLGMAYTGLGNNQRAIGLFEQALTIDRDLGNRHEEGSDLVNLASAYLNLGNVQRSIELYEQALKILSEIGDQFREIYALRGLGMAHAAQGNMNEAIRCHEGVLITARQINDRHSEASSLDDLGNVDLMLGKLEDAIGRFEQALGIADEIGDIRVRASVLCDMGNAYKVQGNAQQAISFYERYLGLTREIHDRRAEGNALGNLGVAYFELQNAPQAIRLSEQALAIRRQLGDQRGEVIDLNNLGAAHFQLGNTQQASGFHEQALKVARAIGDRSGESDALGGLGMICANSGNARQALEYHRLALDIARQVNDRHGEVTNLSGLGNAYFHLQDIEQALEHFQQALIISRELGDTLSKSMISANLAMSMALVGQVDEALSLAQQSAQELEQSGYAQQAQHAKRIYEQILAFRSKLGGTRSVDTDSSKLEEVVYAVLDDPRQAIGFLEQSLKTARKTKDQRSEGLALIGLGNAYVTLGDIRRAVGYLDQALLITRKGDNRVGESLALSKLGDAYARGGDLHRALEYYEQALVSNREAYAMIRDDRERAMFRRNEGNTINSLGVVYKNLGDVRRAIGCYEQALAIAREIGDRLGEGNAVGNLGIAYKRLGNNLKAIDFYEEQLRITREIGDRRGEGNALGNLANACSNLGRVQQAIEYYEQAIRVDREVGDQYGEGIDSGNLAGLLARQGRLTEALPYAEQAVQIYTRIGRTQNALEAQRLVAEIKASLPSLNSTDEDGEEVVACVTCGASLSEHGRANCSALEMRRAVAAGFHPTPEALMAIGAMYGWSLDETLESFLMDVRGLDSDWVLCPSCISRVKLLAARSH